MISPTSYWGCKSGQKVAYLVIHRLTGLRFLPGPSIGGNLVTLQGTGFGGDLNRGSSDQPPIPYQSLGYRATVWVRNHCCFWATIQNQGLTFLFQVGDTRSDEVVWISDSSIAAPAPKVNSEWYAFVFILNTLFLPTVWVYVLQNRNL